MHASPSPADGPDALPDTFLTLAPSHLRNYRKMRYAGDDLYIDLDTLAERDQTLLRRFYEILTELLYHIASPDTDDEQKWRDLALWTRQHDMDIFVDELRELGVASHEQQASERLAKAMHDIRGGALSALLGRLQLFGRLPRNAAQLQSLFVLTRDHLKIMRNALAGLDDPRRNADRKPRAHGMRLMLDKWHESIVGPQWRERPVRMRIDCRYEGTLTECCLESAAVDRIFYNLAANACRHAADDRLDMVIFPVPGAPDGGCVRFVLSNEVGGQDAARLAAFGTEAGAAGADRGHGRSLPTLFEPGVSSTGSGFGLTVVADFVAGAFGLRDRAEALRGRYVGAILDGQTFRVWFHWPSAHHELPPKSDDYHHPKESLSEP